MRSKYEIKAQKELEAEGWRVDNKAGMAHWARNRDFWNLFDLVAVKPGFPMRWISIKGTQGLIRSHLKEIEAFWMPQGNIKELWAKSKSKNKYWSKILFVCQGTSESVSDSNSSHA